MRAIIDLTNDRWAIAGLSEDEFMTILDCLETVGNAKGVSRKFSNESLSLGAQIHAQSKNILKEKKRCLKKKKY